jgi:hypothetical protein
MRRNITLTTLLLSIALASVTAALGGERAKANGTGIQVLLIWGTTNSTSPNTNHTLVEGKVKKRLEQLPLKWSNYFLVNKKDFLVPVGTGQSHKEPLSEKCAVEVKDLGKGNFEVSLFGKGKQVHKRTQALPVGEMLVFGGEAPGSTTWLVVVRRME